LAKTNQKEKKKKKEKRKKKMKGGFVGKNKLGRNYYLFSQHKKRGGRVVDYGNHGRGAER